MKTIAITGGSGFIGTLLTKNLVDRGYRVVVLDKYPSKINHENVSYIKLDLMEQNIPEDIFIGIHDIINLAGAPIFGKFTKSYKKLIYDSRIKTTQHINHAIANSKDRPKVLISASAIGYYGDCKDEPLDEHSPVGKDFLANVCRDWEAETKKAENYGLRTVSIRTGIVLGSSGGILSKLIPLFKMGLGAKLGNGKQWFSWIHVDDLVRIYEHALDNENCSGPINGVSPIPVTNAVLTKNLGNLLHRPAFLFIPAFILKLFLGESSDVVLSSQKVFPQVLKSQKFIYKYEEINPALIDSLANYKK